MGIYNRLTSISIQGPTSSGWGTTYNLKIWENNGDYNTFAPETLVATSTNSTSIPTGGQAVFNFTGQQLAANKVYLFSLTDSAGNDHASFRSRLTDVSGSRLENGSLFSTLSNKSFDVAFTFTLASPPQGTGTIDWENSSDTNNLAIATSSSTSGIGVSSLTIVSADASATMLSEIDAPANYIGYLNGLTPVQNVDNNYSRRITGSITAPVTGNYEFYLAADDDARLYVGTGEAASSRVLVASQSGGVNFQEWTATSSQKSVPINLVAGQRYYIEVQQNDIGGNDHLSVAWTGPGISKITPIIEPSVLPSASYYVRFLTEKTTLVEGQSGQIMIGLDRPNPNASISVNIEVATGGSATQGNDFTLIPTTITFAPGEMTKAISLATLIDSLNEPTEQVSLRLVSTQAQSINPQLHQLIILDGNAPAISPTTGFVERGNSSGALIAQISATTVGDNRTMQTWEILSGNPIVEGSSTPAFAIDNQGNITLANPDALPLSSYQLQLSIRGTDNLGSFSLGTASIVVGGRRLVEERWNGQTAYNNNDWSSAPNVTNTLVNFDAPQNVAENYSRRISGVFTVPTTGNYSFWIAADDAARLTIASYDNPSSELQIASLATPGGYQNWNVQADQESAPQMLGSGQRYILRAYHYENGGGDHLSVAWSGPEFERRVMSASDFLPAQAINLVDAPLPTENNPSQVNSYGLATTATTNTGLTSTISSGSFTRDNTLGLTGTADAGSLVRVYDGTTYLGQTRALENGTWSWMTPALSEGLHTLRAEVLNAYGNIAITAPTTYTIRTAISISGDLHLLTGTPGSTNVTTTGGSADEILGVNGTNLGSVVYNSLSSSGFVEQRWAGSSVYNDNTWDSTTPSYTGSLSTLVATENVGNDYSRRITGTITVSTTGQYTFYIASDDSSRLFLSTDATAANKVQIASVGEGLWTAPQDWNDYSSQKSTAITLQSGQTYYIEIQHLEGSGGDHVSVGWTGPGISNITPISLPATMVVTDIINGSQLVDRNPSSATTSAGVNTTYAGISPNGRYVVFGTSSPAAFTTSSLVPAMAVSLLPRMWQLPLQMLMKLLQSLQVLQVPILLRMAQALCIR